MYLNKVILVGNLTRDPELKAVPSGNKVCTFSLATNRSYKDANGVRQEKTDFHNIVVWGKTAENVATYMKKGSSILVEGRMETRSWDDQKTGEKKYRTEVIAESVQFGNTPGNTQSQAKPIQAEPAKQEPKQENFNKIDGPDELEYPEEQINAEDIPF